MLHDQRGTTNLAYMACSHSGFPSLQGKHAAPAVSDAFKIVRSQGDNENMYMYLVFRNKTIPLLLYAPVFTTAIKILS